MVGRFLLFIFVLFQSAQASTGELLPCNRVENFYQQYLAISDQFDTKKESQFLQANLSNKVYQRIQKIQTEQLYNPIIQAQDYSPNWKKTLSVKLISQKDDLSTCRVVIDPSWGNPIMVKIKNTAPYSLEAFTK